MTRGMRRIVTVLAGGFALLSCGHRTFSRSDSQWHIGTGYLLCPVCAGKHDDTKTA